MKNYAETQGQESFDWNKFLENPPEKGSLEHLEACDLAEAWVTCACGNLCDIIPRSPLGCPIDDYLELLGIAFNNNIQDAEYDVAKKILARIENRSAEIIFELTK
jgi:S-ribosylhomocysteine lyase LuxS involved in autoinducer biosynthesis